MPSKVFSSGSGSGSGSGNGGGSGGGSGSGYGYGDGGGSGGGSGDGYGSAGGSGSGRVSRRIDAMARQLMACRLVTDHRRGSRRCELGLKAHNAVESARLRDQRRDHHPDPDAKTQTLTVDKRTPARLPRGDPDHQESACQCTAAGE